MKKYILILIATIFVLSSCSTYTIPEDALYPLKIGVLVLGEPEYDLQLQCIQPGETLITRTGGSYNGEGLVNTNLHFEIADGFCTLTSDNEMWKSANKKALSRFITNTLATGVICLSPFRKRSAHPVG